MVLVSKGDFVWIEPIRGSSGEAGLPLGARVLDLDHGRIKVLDDHGKEQWLSADRRVRLMHPTSVQGVEDMCQLGDFHESAILRNIFVRYREKLIYTYTGAILIAVNPYMDIPIYTADQIRMYKKKRIGELPPHIFSVADNSYTNMRETKKNQSIVISGESGAGKTESTKLVLQFLATVSGQHNWIEQQVLEANPILEAFGNAKTVRNDNSSRFGKYIDVHFNAAGSIEGARIEQYLLEKSRIVSQAENERNYHIFYCLLAGLSQDERKELELTKAGDYYYLAQGKTLSAEGRDDAADLAEIRSAMKVLMFKEPEIWSIFKILAALLHIGNTKYRGTLIDNMEAVDVSDASNIVRIAKLLQVREQNVLEALTTKTLVTRDERVIRRLTGQQAIDTRDALSKGIYGRLFVYIVNRVNDAIYKPRKDAKRSSIGVLDIFGFEHFANNSFEQLCINYANEHLQQFFVRHVFKMEQMEYEQEQINWRSIRFVDNQETLDLIAQKPMNLLSIIDEESIFPKATDGTMLMKLHANHAKNEGLYLKPRSDLEKAFGVQHFAGPVYYNVKNFLEKNRDSFSADLHSLVAASKMQFLSRLFDDGDYSETTNRRKGYTVGGQFRKSLDVLMNQLGHTEPFFIRCIKPNEYKRAMMMDRELVLRQMRYSGMLETIKIRRSGYPVRHPYIHFVHRYRVLVNGIGPAHKVDCNVAARKICVAVFGRDGDYQLGKTKIFLKDKQDLILEQEYYRMLNERATTIQRAVRGWHARKAYERKRSAAIMIQKTWRAYEQRKRYRQIIYGFCRLQAMLRSRQLVQHYQSLRHCIIQFQSACRGSLVRREVREMRKRGRKVLQKEPVAVPVVVNEDVKEEEIVGQLFDFLPSDKQDSDLDSSSSNSKIYAKSAVSSATPSVDPFQGEDLGKYQFGKFAATFFQAQASATHVKAPIKAPLLQHDEPSTQLAAMASWITILRFMGDLPDLKVPGSPDATYDKTPVMTKLYATLGRKYSRKDVEEASLASDLESIPSRTLKKGMGKKLISMTLKKKSKLTDHPSNASERSIDSSSTTSSGFNALLDNKPMTSLDKLHYIVGLGILKEDLRDEIYCQLCKQLSSNPSKLSIARGWVLMSLCVGCFAPTPRFVKYLMCFIRERGPVDSGYAQYIEQRLRRTLTNGTRHQPPSYVELQGSKSKKAIVLAVTFMDGAVKTLCADSATTSAELCEQLGEKVALKSRFGFSLYIALFDKVSSLGSGSDHVMDAISQCEQYAKEQGGMERNAPWRLFFRKEIFEPWHDPRDDAISTNLIYQQVVRGVKFGEYRCDKEDDLAILCAQQYYAEEGKMDVPRLEQQLTTYLPDFELNKKDMGKEHWVQSVMHQYRKKYGTTQPAQLHVKEEIVTFAKNKWPLLFSRFYEALKFAGPPLPRNEVIIAVNWTGVYVVDDQEQVLLEFSYPEIASVVYGKGKRVGGDTCMLKTIGGEEYTFQSPNAEDIRELVGTFLEGLKIRSRYLVAIKQQKAHDGSDFVEFDRGDLLVLTQGFTGKDLLTQNVLKVENARTCLQGLARVENVYVLPTLTRPSRSTLDQYPKEGSLELDILNNNNHKQVAVFDPAGEKPHTLEKFALDNFSTTNRRSNSQLSLMTLRRKDKTDCERWRFSRDPLTAPLLKKLDSRDDARKESLHVYDYIMKYMGDQPSKRSRLGTDLTDAIFKPAIHMEILRDELYCQLMKQLTYNPSMLSEERGWELMWLAAGVFAPSQSLMKEVSMFLKSRQHPIALDCHNRMQKMAKAGCRKQPPHMVEVEAIQNKTTQIFHKVFFPDHTDEAIEVDSSTKAKDFCNKIAQRLALTVSTGFALFVKIADNKVLAVPEGEFFFDYVRYLSECVQNNHTLRENPIVPVSYQVYFMRKLWMNVKPGEDVNADLIFHYHQESPKYLLGYHKVSKAEAVELAALLLRSITKDTKVAPVGQVPQLLNELVPKDMTKIMSTSDWKKNISGAYVRVEHLSSDQAKIEFLKYISRWQTFGSAFFPVTQCSDLSLPEKLLIAINKHGVNIYNQESKSLIIQYAFNVISNWTSGNTYFNMTVGNLLKGNEGKKLLLDTTMGYKMDDLLVSYMSVLIANQTNPQKKIKDHLI